MTELLSLAKELGSVGFPTVLVVILYGSYKGWWFWASVVTDLKAAHAANVALLKAAAVDMQADYERRLVKAEAANTKWETMALRGVGLAEVGIGLVKKGDT